VIHRSSSDKELYKILARVNIIPTDEARDTMEEISAMEWSTTALYAATCARTDLKRLMPFGAKKEKNVHEPARKRTKLPEPDDEAVAATKARMERRYALTPECSTNNNSRTPQSEPKALPTPSTSIREKRTTAMARAKTPSQLNTAVPGAPISNQKTCFFNLHKRLTPTAHLKALRGPQGNSELFSDKYFSPTLHNVPDAYLRLLNNDMKACVVEAGEDKYRYYRLNLTKYLTHEPTRDRRRPANNASRNKQQDRAYDVFDHLAQHAPTYTFEGRRITSWLGKNYPGGEKGFLERWLKLESDGMSQFGWRPSDWRSWTKKACCGRRVTGGRKIKPVNITLSPAEQDEKEAFLLALRCSRKQATEKMAESLQAIKTNRSLPIKERIEKQTAHSLVSLRLQMADLHLQPSNVMDNVDFARYKGPGAHEVHFRGPLRQQLLAKEPEHLGWLVDRSFYECKDNKALAARFHEREVEKIASFALLNPFQPMVRAVERFGKDGRSTSKWKLLQELSDNATNSAERLNAWRDEDIRSAIRSARARGGLSGLMDSSDEDGEDCGTDFSGWTSNGQDDDTDLTDAFVNEEPPKPMRSTGGRRGMKLWSGA
jgi:hypothetical protein